MGKVSKVRATQDPYEAAAAIGADIARAQASIARAPYEAAAAIGADIARAGGGAPMGKVRTLRLAPRHVMTGDVLVERAYGGGMAETVVTWLERSPNNRGWYLEGVGGPLGYYANQRRLTVKRSGPKGLGEE